MATPNARPAGGSAMSAVRVPNPSNAEQHPARIMVQSAAATNLLLAQILHNFVCGPLALPGCAFHKALELDRAMFAREVDGSLAHALVAAEVGALSHPPAGVAAQKI